MVKLLPWYRANRRSLPWRETPAPYRVWVSEIMLQQTRVETVLPYFARWIERFPDVHALADADLQDVLACWEGLGYYARARNLHKAARIIRDDHEGRLPNTAAGLRKLPGIGEYTAGAIASIAFGRDEPVVDGNVRRVLARVYNIAIPADGPAGRRRLWEIAGEILPGGQAGDHNQALMDLGALICTPRDPNCPGCPVRTGCEANRLGVVSERPLMRTRPETPHHTVTAAVIREGDTVLITRRPDDGLLGGLWEFPGGKLEPGEDLAACLHREIDEELGLQIEILGQIGVYRHAFTHFKVTLHAFDCRLGGNGAAVQEREVAAHRWVTPDKLGTFPMGKIDRSISKTLQAGPATHE
ncbi:MAG TPA: A/G-specific adenine glycosylase [Anaerolineales bacterium]|nr:A/G-specific adenine glycosylase [Anaerolineales bacterium]